MLITGASAGIGRACVWRFAEKGARLVLVARRADKLAELRNDLLAEFPTLHVHIVPMSVTDTDAVAALPAALPAPFRDVYCLVNNAGLALGVSPVDKNVVADAKTMLDANVLGTIAFCSAFIPGMKARGAGHVVNMGSCAGKYAYANGTVYNASKVRAQECTSLHRPLSLFLPIFYTHSTRCTGSPRPPATTSAPRPSASRTSPQASSAAPNSPSCVSATRASTSPPTPAPPTAVVGVPPLTAPHRTVARWGGVCRAQAVYAGIVALQPEDVADNVLYAVTRPTHVQVGLSCARVPVCPCGPRHRHRRHRAHLDPPALLRWRTS